MISIEGKIAAKRLAARIHPWYVLSHWSWLDLGVPSEKEIYKQLLSLLEDAQRLDVGSSVGTGGLRVSVQQTTEHNKYYLLQFIVEEQVEGW